MASTDTNTAAIAASGLAGRYAAALFELAEERGALDQIDKDLSQLQTMIDKGADLRLVICSPIINRDEQERAIITLAEKAKLSELMRKFLGLTIAKRRLSCLPRIINAYHNLLAAHCGVMTVDVISSKELTIQQRDALIASLQKDMGKDVVVKVIVDPALIGGLIIKVGSRMIDDSLRTKFERLRLTMKGIA